MHIVTNLDNYVHICIIITGTPCMAYYFKCSCGSCVPEGSRCNGTIECSDGSDELNCPCRRNRFICYDGSNIIITKNCNECISCKPFGGYDTNCSKYLFVFEISVIQLKYSGSDKMTYTIL